MSCLWYTVLYSVQIRQSLFELLALTCSISRIWAIWPMPWVTNRCGKTLLFPGKSSTGGFSRVFRRVLCWQEETAYERDDILALCNGIKTPPCLSPASFNHRIAACEKTLHRPRQKNERTWKHHFDSAVEVCQSNLPSSLLLLSLALHLTALVAHLPFPMAWEASGSRNVKKLLQMSVTFCIYTTI